MNQFMFTHRDSDMVITFQAEDNATAWEILANTVHRPEDFKCDNPDGDIEFSIDDDL